MTPMNDKSYQNLLGNNQWVWIRIHGSRPNDKWEKYINIQESLK